MIPVVIIMNIPWEGQFIKSSIQSVFKGKSLLGLAVSGMVAEGG